MLSTPFLAPPIYYLTYSPNRPSRHFPPSYPPSAYCSYTCASPQRRSTPGRIAAQGLISLVGGPSSTQYLPTPRYSWRRCGATAVFGILIYPPGDPSDCVSSVYIYTATRDQRRSSTPRVQSLTICTGFHPSTLGYPSLHHNGTDPLLQRFSRLRVSLTLPPASQPLKI